MFPVIELALSAVLGLVLGSFSTALIYRVPRRLKWGAKRSACPNCKTQLGILDLFPVFSWVFSRGKCRHCNKPISAVYPLIEVVGAFLCAGAYAVFGFGAEMFFVAAAVPVLVSLFVIDLKHMILPNQLVFALMVIGLGRLFYFSISDVFVSVPDLMIPYIVGAVVYAIVPWALGAVLTKVLKKDSLGMGDVKFFFVSGLWLGLSVLPYFMMMSGLLAMMFAVAWRLIVGGEAFPFGPALIASFYGLLLFQGSFLM
ncbi:MAG: prepilin peptidase [Alphaproteobacteria bacterium]